MKNLFRTHSDLFSRLRSSDPQKYVQLFMAEYIKIIASPRNAAVLYAVLIFSALTTYLKSEDTRYLIYRALALALNGTIYFFLRRRPARLSGWLPYFIGLSYLSFNFVAFIGFQIRDWQDITQASLIILQVLIPIAFAIMSVVPYLALNLLVNLGALFFFYLYFHPAYVSMGILIVPLIWQIWGVTLVITSILHFTVRSRALSRLQHEEIERSAQTVRNIFDSINQAVFLIETDAKSGRIFVKSGIRSPLCRTLLGFPQGEDACGFDEYFLSRIEGEPAGIVEAQEAIATAFGASELTWELNASKLLHSIRFRLDQDDIRHLTLSYVPIYNKSSEISQVLITALDDTELLIAQSERQGQVERMNLIVEMVGTGRDRIQKGISLIIALVDQAGEILLALPQNPRKFASEAFIPFHTAKGNARTLGLKTLSHDIHTIEDVLIVLRTHGYTVSTVEALQDKLKFLQMRIEQYKSAMDRLGWSLKGEETLTLTTSSYKTAMSYDSWRSMRAAVDEGQDPNGEIALFLSPAFRRLTDILPIMSTAVRRAASALQKEMPIVRSELDQLWVTSELMEEITAICPHIAGNMLDHGIECASERQKKSKTANGHIRISKDFSDSKLRLIFQDDGRGLNLHRLLEKAIKSDILPPGTYADEELTALIFQEGFSTKDEATELSGRGIGMMAVKKSVEKFSGSVRIDLRETLEPGFRQFAMVLEYPETVVWQ